jgi:hypothetical protein
LPLGVPGDAFHSNSVQVLDGSLSSKLPAFKKGNLLISLRRLGILIVIDPKNETIEWLMDSVFWDIGQHWAKLLENGNILVFDNYFNYKKKLSRIIEFDPIRNKIVWDYLNSSIHFYSSIAGQCYRLPNGNTLINESANGHTIEVTPSKKTVWEFYNPNRAGSNKELVAVIYQMERIPVDRASRWLKK